MKSKITILLVTLLGLALLGYTAVRTLDLIALTLPSDKQVTAYLALAAFDGGLVLWALFFMNGARGQWQRGIAILMTIVSAVGVIAALAGDTFYHTGTAGLTRQIDPAFIESVVWIMVTVIALNIAAVTGVHLTDPDRLKAQAEAEALDKIEDATLQKIAASADSLAAELAPMKAAAWVEEMRARHGASVVPASKTPQLARPTTPKLAVVYNAEAADVPAIAQPEGLADVPAKSSRNGRKPEGASKGADPK